MDAELDHDSGPMRFDSPDGDMQQRGNFFIRLSLGQESNDFSLARRSSADRLVTWLVMTFHLEKGLQHDFGHLRSKESLSLGDGLHRFCEGVREIGFQKVPAGSS